MAKAQSEKTKLSFEESLQQLDAQVRKLEGGELSLDESIAVFEQGMKLAQSCETTLAEAKGKVEILLKQADGSVTTESFTQE